MGHTCDIPEFVPEKIRAENKRLMETLKTIVDVSHEPFSSAIAKAAIAESEGET